MGNDTENILRNCVVAACFTCLICAILGHILIRCMERETSQRAENVVHPV